MKIKTVEKGLYKMPRFEKSHLETRVFETGITVASGESFMKHILRERRYMKTPIMTQNMNKLRIDTWKGVVIQPVKFRTMETGLYKIPCFEKSHFETAVAFGHCHLNYWFYLRM